MSGINRPWGDSPPAITHPQTISPSAFVHRSARLNIFSLFCRLVPVKLLLWVHPVIIIMLYIVGICADFFNFLLSLKSYWRRKYCQLVTLLELMEKNIHLLSGIEKLLSWVDVFTTLLWQVGCYEYFDSKKNWNMARISFFVSTLDHVEWWGPI